MGLPWRKLTEEVFDDLGVDVNYDVPEENVGLKPEEWERASAFLERRPVEVSPAAVTADVRPVVAPLALDDFAVPAAPVSAADFESAFGTGAGRRVAGT